MRANKYPEGLQFCPAKAITYFSLSAFAPRLCNCAIEACGQEVQGDVDRDLFIVYKSIKAVSKELKVLFKRPCSVLLFN